MYVIDSIERTKNATNCSSSNDEVKIELRSMILTINCNKSRLTLASLVVRVVQILYCNKLTKANSLVFSRASLDSLCSQGLDKSSMLIAHTLSTI